MLLKTEEKSGDGLVSVVDIILKWVRWCMACRHGNTPLAEGKSYCPDCGCGVVFQWVNLRCGGCNIRRDTRYSPGFLLKSCLLPQEPACVHCGERAVYPEYLENARPYQIQRARLVMHSDTDYERERLAAFWTSGVAQVRVWMDGPPTGNRVRGLLPA